MCGRLWTLREEGGERGAPLIPREGKDGSLLLPSLLEGKGNCVCLANLLHYIMDIFLTCELFEKT